MAGCWVLLPKLRSVKLNVPCSLALCADCSLSRLELAQKLHCTEQMAPPIASRALMDNLKFDVTIAERQATMRLNAKIVLMTKVAILREMGEEEGDESGDESSAEAEDTTDGGMSDF